MPLLPLPLPLPLPPLPPTLLPAQFFFLQYVDPATYQILGNLKIVTTGLLLRLALRRYLSKLQWMALLLLMTGAATSQINTDCSLGTTQSVLQAPFLVSCERGGMRAGMLVGWQWAPWQQAAIAGGSLEIGNPSSGISYSPILHPIMAAPLQIPPAAGLCVWRGERVAVGRGGCLHRMGAEEEQRHAVLAKHAAVRFRGLLQLCKPRAQVGCAGGRGRGLVCLFCSDWRPSLGMRVTARRRS